MSIFGKLFGGRPTVDGISGALIDDALPEMEQSTEEEAIQDIFFSEDEEAEEQSFEELVELAAKGDKEAMLSVGMAHIEGEGAPIDIKKGMTYVIDAAEHGSLEAAGLLYEWARDRINGLGKEKEEVMRFRELGARVGDVVAQVQLAQCYAAESDQWSDYQQNKPLAHFWFAQGYANGNAFSAMGYAAGLLIGLSSTAVAPVKNENGIIENPTEEQLDSIANPDPESIAEARENGIKLLSNIASSPSSAGIIAYKLLNACPEGERDYQAMYTAVIKAMNEVRA